MPLAGKITTALAEQGAAVVAATLTPSEALTHLAERFRVIAPDLRGHGWSEAPAGGYEKEQLASDMLGVPVLRPRVTETTAMGAAYFAGLAAGFWHSAEQIATQRPAASKLPRLGPSH